jgi:hypothetical protein
MKPEFPSVDQQRMVSPHAQEIEYALILQRMISAVKDDPAQMRLTIYEFARARLKIDTSWTDENERERLAAALETAIQGVEEFSISREERERLPPPNPPASTPKMQLTAAPPPGPAVTTLRPVAVQTEEILAPRRAYLRPKEEPFVEVHAGSRRSALARFGVGMLLFGLVAGMAYYRQRFPSIDDQWHFAQLTASKLIKPSAVAPAANTTPAAPAAADASPAIAAPAPFPLPSDYGVYALSNDKLSELFTLSEAVPDKRIAVSTPIDKPSRTILPDGKAKFIIFRRDIGVNATDRIEVRVVARVVRAMSFDAKGKPVFNAVSNTWNMRSVSYELRVRPIPGNSEMLLVQSSAPDFELPPGRYVLVLKNQGYDFTVAGAITDLAQCLERTDAANGTFYSECLKF